MTRGALELVGIYVRELSRYIDLERLDGVTLAYDYEATLAELDRGVEGLRTLIRSEDYGVGIAMTATVLRDGVVKSHIIIHPEVIRAIEDESNEDYHAALYTLAHECAHVEINKAFDSAFPGLTLKQRHQHARGNSLADRQQLLG